MWTVLIAVAIVVVILLVIALIKFLGRIDNVVYTIDGGGEAWPVTLQSADNGDDLVMSPEALAIYRKMVND